MIEVEGLRHAYGVPCEDAREYAFALFSLRLAGTESVIDFSGDHPAFVKALRDLYPRVRYARGDAAGSFDRGVWLRCAATESRLAEAARLVKPGGLLVITWTGRADFPLPSHLVQFGESRGAVFHDGGEPPRTGKRIVLSLLTWNLKEIALASLGALVREAEMLERLGHRPFLVLCDNGSTDGTAEALRALDSTIAIPHRFLLQGRNLGSGAARNRILDVMRDVEGDFLLWVDGDIEVVPFSTFAMLRWLEDSPSGVGSIGAHCHSQTRVRQEATPYLFHIPATDVEDDRDKLWVAWTQYGLFRREVFDAGVQFDESGAFARPGWGCEDVDLAFQMHSRGFYNQSFGSIVYLHRNLNSSIPLLRESGVDPRKEFRLRCEYLLAKWDGASLGKPTLDFLRRTQPDF
jgi:GT2 family glycosyltransferase